jgi:hypothetical protein
MFEGAYSKMTPDKVNLPKTIGEWTRPDAPKVINSNNIFEYMNGAGELYLGYRFHHLEVYEYVAGSQSNILVELYFMKNSDDAFGLLSLDWSGDPVIVNLATGSRPSDSLAPLTRALYGGGLLRLCADKIYARIMASQETHASKEAVLSLGRAIAANRGNPPEPGLLKILPATVGLDWKLRKDRIGYFRSYLVLNTFYYLSHQNILNLDLTTEAVSAPYEYVKGKRIHKRLQFLFLKYENDIKAQHALDRFNRSYLPEHKINSVTELTTESSNYFKIEDGWLGYKLLGPCIAMVFECPDRESAQRMIKQIQFK